MSRIVVPEFGADIPPATPDATNDEFPDNTLDGKWSWLNQGDATATVADGRCILQADHTDIHRGIYQSVPVGNWKYRVKMLTNPLAITSYSNHGILVSRGTASDHSVFGPSLDVITRSTSTGTGVTSRDSGNEKIVNRQLAWLYVEAEWDGTDVFFRYSIEGQVYLAHSTWTPAGAPTLIGVGMNAYNSGGINDSPRVFEWFRRIA